MLYTQELADKLVKALADVNVKDITEDDAEWSFDVIASTDDVDRDGEVIKITARDESKWLKNPVVLANHCYTIESIIGKGLEFYTSGGVKRLKGVFSKTNPLAIIAKQLYQEGMLKAVSVGFIVKERDPANFSIITQAELLEVSFVAVPANPNAISLDGKLFEEAVSKGLIIVQTDDAGDEGTEDETAENEMLMSGIKDMLTGFKNDILIGVSELMKEYMSKSVSDDKDIEDDITTDAEVKEAMQVAARALGGALEKVKKKLSSKKS